MSDLTRRAIQAIYQANYFEPEDGYYYGISDEHYLANQIRKFSDFGYTLAHLLRIPNCGLKTVAHILSVAGRHGVVLKDKPMPNAPIKNLEDSGVRGYIVSGSFAKDVQKLEKIGHQT